MSFNTFYLALKKILTIYTLNENSFCCTRSLNAKFFSSCCTDKKSCYLLMKSEALKHIYPEQHDPEGRQSTLTYSNTNETLNMPHPVPLRPSIDLLRHL